jgi:hypothetical protein
MACRWGLPTRLIQRPEGLHVVGIQSNSSDVLCAPLLNPGGARSRAPHDERSNLHEWEDGHGKAREPLGRRDGPRRRARAAPRSRVLRASATPSSISGRTATRGASRCARGSYSPRRSRRFEFFTARRGPSVEGNCPSAGQWPPPSSSYLPPHSCESAVPIPHRPGRITLYGQWADSVAAKYHSRETPSASQGPEMDEGRSTSSGTAKARHKIVQADACLTENALERAHN